MPRPALELLLRPLEHTAVGMHALKLDPVNKLARAGTVRRHGTKNKSQVSRCHHNAHRYIGTLQTKSGLCNHSGHRKGKVASLSVCVYCHTAMPVSSGLVACCSVSCVLRSL